VEVQLGAAKVAKYAAGESGDTLEVIERPHGGLSAVLADGQRSGRSAKVISNIVARKAISLLGEGVRDGAVARAAHDYLRTHREGQVSAELQMLSVDLQSCSIVISRNSRCPALIVRAGNAAVFDDPSEPIGIHCYTKPVIRELPLEPDTYVILYTDGLTCGPADAASTVALLSLVEAAARGRASAQALADQLLRVGLTAQSGRPKDDISVLVMAVLSGDVPHGVRRLSVSFPV